MKAKAVVLASALSASILVAAPAQAHHYHDAFPYGLVGGLFLGLTWSHYHDHDHHYRYGDRHYRHREYRRSESYGRHRHDRHRHHRDGDRHRHRRDR